MKRVLSIAGSDSGGGAGIQADLKTCGALGCHGMTAITAITAQNTLTVTDIHEIPVHHVQAQIAAVLDDIGVDAVKTGMLSSEGIIETVAATLLRYDVRNIVVDPVMISKSGAHLLRNDAIEKMKHCLVPLATVITPNIPEAVALTGLPLNNESDIPLVLEALKSLGPKYVLLKGGHMESDLAMDYLYDGHDVTPYSLPRIHTKHTHGTGCTLSSAIACFLARDLPVLEAIGQAKDYLTHAISHSEELQLGNGVGPVHHFWSV